MAQTTIPYNQFQFKDLQVSIGGNKAALLESITYEVSQPKTPIYSKGKTVALQTENTDINGVVSMMPSEVHKYMKYFADEITGLDFNLSKFVDQYFEIIAYYSRTDVTSKYEFASVTETFKNCKFHTVSMSALQGEGLTPVELPFTCCEMTSKYKMGES